MLWLRSITFNLAFYLMSAVVNLAATPFFFLPRAGVVWAMRGWSRLTMWLLKTIVGTHYEIRGAIPKGPVLVASKHQSMWDTIIFTGILDDPAMVLKSELLWIPYYGWFSKKAKMIAIDRGSGASAVRRLVAQGKAALTASRPIVIFPEGSRMAPGAAPGYKPGVAALYRQLGVACVPVAVNSGLYWPRRRFLRRPGTIVLEFLDPIPPGLDRRTFMATLEARTEAATAKLLAEGGMSAGS